MVDVTTGRTGNNERTTYDPNTQTVDVVYHVTTIIHVDLDRRRIRIDSGGWHTVSTVTHLNKAFKRLHEEIPWIPPFHFYRRNGEIQWDDVEGLYFVEVVR